MNRLKESFTKAAKVVLDVAKDPASMLALGSIFMTAASEAHVGTAAYVLAFGIIAALKAQESWSGVKKGLPFGFSAFVNFVAAAALAERAFRDGTLDSDNVHRIFMTGAYMMWMVRSIMLSLKDKHQKGEPESFTDDPQFYQGLGALMTTRMHPVLMALSGVGILRTMFNKPFQALERSGVGNVLTRHYKATRAYALQYGVSAGYAALPMVTAIAARSISEDLRAYFPLQASDALITAAFLTWSWAFVGFELNEKDCNHDGGQSLDQPGLFDEPNPLASKT